MFSFFNYLAFCPNHNPNRGKAQEKRRGGIKIKRGRKEIRIKEK
jgi:hypothetical protein